MTRSLLILGFAFIGVTTMNIAKAQQNIRDSSLVDKIYDYHNNLLAEYIYDDSNRLVKKIVKDHLIEPNRTIDRRWEDEFEYENGRVSKIKTYNLYIDNSPIWGFKQESNKETVYEYDSQGRLMTGGNFLYEDKYLVSTRGYYFGPCFYRDTLVYDNSMNVIKHVFVSPETNMVEQPILGTYKVQTKYYEYDNKPKPNFGLDYLFVYNPYPYLNGPDWEKALSKNNMTKAVDNGYLWFYTYNENGLPATIETKWIGIETADPMILRFTYKQIKTGISEVSQESSSVNIYPNPAKDKFFIECGIFGTIKLYDMFGKEVLNQNINGKSEINISHLSKGIYNINILSGGIVIGNSKIVKQ